MPQQATCLLGLEGALGLGSQGMPSILSAHDRIMQPFTELDVVPPASSGPTWRQLKRQA